MIHLAGPSKPMQPFVLVPPPSKQSTDDSSGHKLKTVDQIITDKQQIGHLTIELAANHIFCRNVLLSSTISGRNLNALYPVKLSELKYAVKFVRAIILSMMMTLTKSGDVCYPHLLIRVRN